MNPYPPCQQLLVPVSFSFQKNGSGIIIDSSPPSRIQNDKVLKLSQADVEGSGLTSEKSCSTTSLVTSNTLLHRYS
uniref:Putative ovule protein n=1 Tax=Solanum chacoense TaxID=4108 RepID=A0A0V0HSM7_SOLCH